MSASDTLTATEPNGTQTSDTPISPKIHQTKAGTGRKIVRCLAVLTVVLSLTMLHPPAADASTSYTSTANMSCLAVYNGPGGSYRITANVSFTIYYYRTTIGGISGSNVTKVAWNYSGARHSYNGGLSIGTSNNVNLISPNAWNSPDNLGASGVYDTPDTFVFPGQAMQIQGIPDVGGWPDPKCTASRTL